LRGFVLPQPPSQVMQSRGMSSNFMVQKEFKVYKTILRENTKRREESKHQSTSITPPPECDPGKGRREG
jgi:hypothetical protein